MAWHAQNGAVPCTMELSGSIVSQPVCKGASTENCGEQNRVCSRRSRAATKKHSFPTQLPLPPPCTVQKGYCDSLLVPLTYNACWTKIKSDPQSWPGSVGITTISSSHIARMGLTVRLIRSTQKNRDSHDGNRQFKRESKSKGYELLDGISSRTSMRWFDEK